MAPTETNAWGLKEYTVHMKGVIPWLVHWAVVPVQEICPALAALVGPVQNIIFPHWTPFRLICPFRLTDCAGNFGSIFGGLGTA